ncbi:MAG: YfiR family protein [Methylococcales bacterium]|nr:YfiR family protein [Methylococcales bacterium]MCK5925564.1 YfiR family protein [Methylococcales bacterium]
MSISAHALDREKVQAKYLKSLSSNVIWPPSSVQAKSASFDLCILGENNFKDYLEKVYTTKSKIQRKPVRVIYINKAEESMGCHVLFISLSEDTNLEAILDFVSDKPIMTVSAIRGFIERNGLFQYYMQGTKVKIKGNSIIFTGHLLKINPALSNVIKFY